MKLGKQSVLLAAGGVIVLVAAFFLLRGRSSAPSSGPPMLDAKAEDLKATHVTASLDVPIDRGTNLLWCGTFQLAWNEASDYFGEELHFTEDAPLIAGLNRRNFTKGDLDEASYVAAGGLLTDSLVGRIQTEMKHKFGGEFTPELLPQSNTNSNQLLLFYAALFKNLAFEKQFERLDHPLVFGTNEVAAFGIERWSHSDPDNLWQQVRMLDYSTTNDFIIELKTKSKRDTLILAKVPPKHTLAATVDGVRSRSQNASRQRVNFDELVIPKTDFKLLRSFGELEGKQLSLKKTLKWNGLPIVAARQLIRFRLDERGAVLQSESSVPVASNISPESVSLFFDKPFLVLLARAGEHSPYFALWIDNTELLVPWKAK